MSAVASSTRACGAPPRPAGHERARHPRFPAAASGTRAPPVEEERRVLRAAEGLEMLIFYLIYLFAVFFVLPPPTRWCR